MKDKVEEILSSFQGGSRDLIPVLQAVQKELGYLSEENMTRIARQTGLPASKVYGVATFYTQFRLEPIGENLIQVCHGTACHLAGAERITEAIQFDTKAPAGSTSPDGKYTLEKVACVGCCSLAPVMNVNEDTHGRLTPDKIKKIFKAHRKASEKQEQEAGCKGACQDA